MSNQMAYSDLRCNMKKPLRYFKNSCLVNNCSAIIFIINNIFLLSGFFYFVFCFEDKCAVMEPWTSPMLILEYANFGSNQNSSRFISRLIMQHNKVIYAFKTTSYLFLEGVPSAQKSRWYI